MNQRVKELFKVIADANKELEQIRATCPHESYGEYSYANERPPNYEIAELCKGCGKYHRYLRQMEWENKVSGPRELTQEEIATLGEEQLRLEKEWEQEQQKQL